MGFPSPPRPAVPASLAPDLIGPVMMRDDYDDNTPKGTISILSYSGVSTSTLTGEENHLYFNEIFQTTGSDQTRGTR